jgi:potassium-dependent mechanosensitive channel
MIAPMHWMKQGIASVALAALAIGCPMRTACAGDPPLDRESPQALLSQAEHAESTGDPRVVAIAHLNVESARALIAAHEEAVDAARRLDALRASLEALRGTMKLDEQRVRLAGAGSGPVSEVLMRHREAVPALAVVRRESETARAQAATAEIARLDAAEALARLGRPVEVAASIIAAQPTGRATVNDLVPLLHERADRYVRPLADALGRASAIDAELESVHAEYESALAQYRDFVDAHLVWLPSMSAVGPNDVRGLAEHASRFVDRGFWWGISSDVLESIRFRPFRWLGAAALVAGLLVLRGRVFRLLAAASITEVSSSTGTGIGATLRSVAETAVAAAPYPLALAMVGGLIESTPTATTAEPFGRAMLQVSGLAYLLVFTATLSAPGGTAERHLRWTPSVVAALRRAALVLVNITVPALFVAHSALGTDTEPGSDALARWSVIAALVVLAMVSARLLRPTSGILAPVIARHPGGWISILRSLWYPAMVALPALLAIAAAAGYVITATTVIENLARSYWVLLLLAMGISVLEPLGGEALDRFDLGGDLEAKEEARFEQQLRNFGRLLLAIVMVAGFAWAWQDLVPALSVINGIVVWTVAGSGDGPPVAVTVADAVLFAATVFVTFSVVRDLPGIVNIVVLRRFPIDRSARYALVTLGRYLMVVVGLVAALACLRVRWSDVQWLAAAVTVGLGFGLQEIFANFVSGLILLAERPIRIGDLVTVDGMSGRVTRIAARATTLIDFDNKDVIIPNKQLITGKIVNWTLQEPSVRLVLRVALAADADLEVGVAALREAAAGSVGVLANPGPDVLLVGFAGGTVELDVAVYIARPSEMAACRHDLVLRAKRLLAARGVGVAFPQLEVHVHPAPSGAH